MSALTDLLAQAQELRRQIESATLTSFGANVKRAREAKSWTQDDLAGLIGLTRSSVANIEAGRQDTPLSRAAIIAAALDSSLGDLAT